jgi:hypothetical protein
MYSGVCNKHGKQEGFLEMILQPEKGQQISEAIYGVLDSPKKDRKKGKIDLTVL